MPLLRGVFSSRPQGAVSSYDRLVQLETAFLRSVRGGVAISARHAFAFYDLPLNLVRKSRRIQVLERKCALTL